MLRPRSPADQPQVLSGVVAKTSLFKDRSVVDKSSDAMRKAGLPDKSPSIQP